MLLAHPAMGVEQYVLLPGMGAACNPDRAARGVQCPQCRAIRRNRRGQREVELDVTHHVGAQRIRPDVAKALGICGALRRDHDAVRQRLPEERGEAPVTANRTWRDTRAREHQWHAAPATFVIQVRPQFGFEDDRDTRSHAVEESAHRSGQVVRDIAHVREPGKQRTRALRPRRCDGGHDQRHFGVPLAQRAYESCRGLYFANRHGVHPEAGTRVRGHTKAEPLAEIAPVAVITKAPQQHRDTDQRRKEIDHAQIQQAHRRKAFAKLRQPGTCTPAATGAAAGAPSR